MNVDITSGSLSLENGTEQNELGGNCSQTLLHVLVYDVWVEIWELVSQYI